MDVKRLLLDRELLLSAALHDLRGPLTAVQGWAELEEDRGAAGPSAAISRVTSLLDTLGKPPERPAESASFDGVEVRVRAPIDVLKMAIDDLPHGEVVVERVGERVAIRITGVPPEECPRGWSMPQVLRWQAEGGPGLAGARLRIAARLLGALRQESVSGAGPAQGSVTIWLQAG